MGSSASKRKTSSNTIDASTESNAKGSPSVKDPRIAIMSVGVFAKHSKHSKQSQTSPDLRAEDNWSDISSRSSMEDLSSFMRRMKSEKEMAKSAIETDELWETRFHVRPKTAPKRPVRDTNKRIWDTKVNTICHICRKPLVQFEDKPYPCRVCYRVYHIGCLRASAECRPVDIAATERVDTNIGWSCYKCTNLSVLLTQDEMEMVINDFEDSDINGDSALTLEEFTTYQKAKIENLQGCLNSQQDKQVLLLKFKLMDYDQDGKIDWWEFVNQECGEILAKRPKEEVVDMLTEKELISAKATFNALDRNGDGRIMEEEAVSTFRQWYKNFSGQFERTRLNSITTIYRDSKELQMHSEIGTMIVMDADENKSGYITWREFLQQQALYIICARPNTVLPL